ncbi:MAG: hypothetical protein CSA61_01695 [Neptuniibacter caesariensis]|uniref:Uncharacterized protein n=1 Tax=Neptuniibacter caesariensis TaxID=207954 RepID=A0A2G6JD34_NEPCE|nr:MAG: hypothetical protein CSA61_01695 [Neptuniibacter caesariensis]
MNSKFNLRLILCLGVSLLVSSKAVASTVAQSPLFLGEGNVPGNLALVPSVEWPTVLSAANIGAYDETEESIGYFDSKKCYSYHYSNNAADRHFYPVSVTADYTCPGPVWSGNFLNWATTQTIDPFRWALTGGYRVKDTATETWLEKARHSGQNLNFNRREISGSAIVNNATPFSSIGTFKTYVGGLGNEMHFELPSGHGFTNIVSGAGPSSLVFADGDFSSGWNKYENGQVMRSATEAHDSGGFSLKKTTHNDKNGGYKNIGSTYNFDNFIYEVWIYRPTVGTQSGQSDRLALSDNNATGYGFNISQGNIRIERRNNGGASSMGQVAWTRPTDEWYRVVFQSEPGDKFKLTVYNASGTQLATHTSAADTNFDTFSRVYVHGGHEYYVDDMKLLIPPSGSSVAYEDVGTDKFGTTVRVKVCDPNVGVEENCKQYGSNWKPEGLIQKYSDRIRYSIFGYLNERHVLRDGGVLRAEQKFVGPEKLIPGTGITSNSNKEWNESTGILVQNPDPAAASSTASYYGVPVSDSGILNYLNKFGQLNNNPFKSYDPVSELYYTALRYFKGQSNVEAYYTKAPSHNASPGTTETKKWVDGFPVIRGWGDPMQYACQKNVILGIGDVNTHRDKNLPSASPTSGVDEPTKPPEVVADATVDVRTATDKVAELESISIDTEADSYSGRRNSAFMAGLAYDANTKDIRDDWPGKQTVQTYWVDVLENEVLRNKRNNQFWLTAKYGGFEVRKHPNCTDPNYTPTGTECDEQSLGDPYTRTDALPEWWWYTNTDMLNPNSGSDYRRADNFYTAGEARKMVDGLTDAFAAIADSLKGSGGAAATNGARLNTNSASFIAIMDSHDWSGDLVAKKISTVGGVEVTDIVYWSAATIMDALTDALINSRKVFTSTYANAASGVTLNSGGVEFKWASLSSEQKESLRKTPSGGTLVTPAVGEQRLNYLRGVRAEEISDTDISKPFRGRGSRLGDIVNSSPVFINKKNYGYSSLSSPFAANVSQEYRNYRASSTYVNKPDIIAVGANDGFLHVFNATIGSDGGKELFAYTPSATFDNLYQLTEPTYVHRYYVDGVVRVADAWFDTGDVPTGVTPGWKTVIAVTPGAGGQGVSLIDVSDPENMDANSVLWEFRHDDMGAMIQSPTIFALPNGKFGVIVTSGLSAPGTDGYIWILNVANGSIIKEFVVPGGNSLAEPSLVDLNRDGILDRIYVGGTDGKFWRFDLLGPSAGFWGAPAHLLSGTTAIPMFTAKDALGNVQPITSSAVPNYDSKGRLMLYFGTGSFYRDGDNIVDANSPVQTLYGIIDRNQIITGRAQLNQQRIKNYQLVSGDPYVALSNKPMQITDRGWYVDMSYQDKFYGALNQNRPVYQLGRVVFTTLIPSTDPCKAGGYTYEFSLDPDNGGNVSFPVYDVNGDGVVDDNDYIEYTETDAGGNTVTVRVFASGKGSEGINNTTQDSYTKDDDGNSYVVSPGKDGSGKIEIRGTEYSEGRQSWREIR